MTFDFQKSGLSKILVEKMKVLKELPNAVVVSILCFAASLFTEITSNSAITSIMLPLVFEMVTAWVFFTLTVKRNIFVS